MKIRPEKNSGLYGFEPITSAILVQRSKIISLGNCFGNVTRPMTRNTFAVVNSVTNWNSLVSLTLERTDESNSRKDSLATIKGVPLLPVKRKPTKIVYTDASDSARGSNVQFEDKIVHQNWSDFEFSRCPAFGELLVASLSLQAFIDSLEGQTVVWFADNQNVARIVNISSKVPALQIIGS